jgi:hypothetical protein
MPNVPGHEGQVAQERDRGDPKVGVVEPVAGGLESGAQLAVDLRLRRVEGQHVHRPPDRRPGALGESRVPFPGGSVKELSEGDRGREPVAALPCSRGEE